MGRPPAPGPIFVGDGDHDRWWVALLGRKNKRKDRPKTRREDKPRGRSKTGVRKDKKGGQKK